MKKFIITVLMVASACMAFSQTNKEDIDLMQSVFGKEKKEMVAQFIQLEGPQKDAFWTLYDEYETKRKELGKSRIDLLVRYVNSYGTLDDAGTDQVINDIMKQQGATDKLVQTYYGKIKKASGTKVAAQFYQFENYILSKIRAEIMEKIPLIGEFEVK